MPERRDLEFLAQLESLGEEAVRRQLAISYYLRHCYRMSDQPNIKPDARQLVESLPDSATWDDLAYEIFVRQAIEAGLRDSEAGRVLSHEDAMALIHSRIRRAS